MRYTYGLEGTYAYTGSKNGYFDFEDGVATFSLKHNETIYAYLPYYYEYRITQNSDGYTLSSSSASGYLNDDKTASFINTKNGITPSGIFLDLVPFIVLITLGILGVFTIKKFKYI